MSSSFTGHKNVELVVATCKEDLSWIDSASAGYDKVTVYDKCDVNPTFKANNVIVHSVPNVGSCDNAFLSYITDRYETLPPAVEFTKGKTSDKRHEGFDCSRKCSRSTKDHPSGSGGYATYTGDGTLSFKMRDYSFAHNQSQKMRFVSSEHANMGEWVDKDTPLSRSMFHECGCHTKYGGNFKATRQQIRNMPVEVYENLKRQQKHANEEVDHFIERSWGTLFCTTQPSEKAAEEGGGELPLGGDRV